MNKALLLPLAMMLLATAGQAREMKAGDVGAEAYIGILKPLSQYDDYGGVAFDQGLSIGLNLFYNITPHIAVGGFFEAGSVTNDDSRRWYDCGNDRCDIELKAVDYMGGAAAAFNIQLKNPSYNFFAQAKVGIGRVRSTLEITPFWVAQTVRGPSEKATPFSLEAGIRWYPDVQTNPGYFYTSLRYLSFRGEGLTDISGVSVNIGCGF